MRRSISTKISLSLQRFLPAFCICALSATEIAAQASGGAWRKSPSVAIEETGRRFGADVLREPLALAVDQRSFVYVADAMAGKVFRFDERGVAVEFEHPGSSSAFYPIDLAAEGSTVYILDYAANKVFRYDYRGAFLDAYISFSEFGRMRPVSFTAGEEGRFITTDIETSSVTVWTPLLQVELTIGDFGWAEGSFDGPRKAAGLPGGGMAIVESGNRRVQLLSSAGRFERSIAPPDDRPLKSPRWIAVDGRGTLFVADADAGALYVFTSEGALLFEIDSYGGEAISPSAAAVAWDDHLYIADLASRSVLVCRLHYE